MNLYLHAAQEWQRTVAPFSIVFQHLGEFQFYFGTYLRTQSKEDLEDIVEHEIDLLSTIDVDELEDTVRTNTV